MTSEKAAESNDSLEVTPAPADDRSSSPEPGVTVTQTDPSQAESTGSEPVTRPEQQEDTEALVAGNQKNDDDSTRPVPHDDPARNTLLDILQSNSDLFDGLANPLSDNDLVRLLQIGDSLPDLVLQVSKNKTLGLDDNRLAHARLVKAVVLANRQSRQIKKLLAEAAEISFRNTNELVRIRKQLRQFKSEIGWPQDAPKSTDFNELLATEQHLDRLAEQNQQFQEQLLVNTNELVEKIGKALEEGNSKDASSLWDKIQNNIKLLSGRAQHDFKLQTAEFRNQVNELRDWKKFAATEKKKELIAQMQSLVSSDFKPPEKAKQINKLHEEWKRLGYSNQNESLWREFKTTSDEAYAPCKEYFKNQKANMAENFRQRNAICERLEKCLGELDHDSIMIVELRKMADDAQNDWKKFAPVEQARVKKQQKRFYDALNKIRDIRRTAARKNGELKLALVEQARQLASLDDSREAINKAKELQAQWKTIGPSFFKDDRRQWDEFRAACDAVFKERDEAKKARKSDITAALASSNEILQQLQQLTELEDEPFRQSRTLFSSLQRDFNQALSPKIKKERRQLLDRFNSLTRQLEARFRKLPDKKEIQAHDALQAKAQHCLALELKLLACNNDESLQRVVSEVDEASLRQFDNSGIPELDQAMESRWKSLLAQKSVANLQKLVDAADQQARKQVVEMEIAANLDSPDQDKSLRMELQLNQLTSNFGKASNENTGGKEKKVRHQRLRYLCVGPLSTAMRTDLEQRIAAIVDPA